MLTWNVAPNFIKFETFPVFDLPADHPLNRAFAAVTADLGHQIVKLSSGETNYDKDIGNCRYSLQNIRRYVRQWPIICDLPTWA